MANTEAGWKPVKGRTKNRKTLNRFKQICFGACAINNFGSIFDLLPQVFHPLSGVGYQKGYPPKNQKIKPGEEFCLAFSVASVFMLSLSDLG